MQVSIGYLLIVTLISLTNSSSMPRNLQRQGTSFIDSKTKVKVILDGVDVVVKGPPYLPYTNGTLPCFVIEMLNKPGCEDSGNCNYCTSFNDLDLEFFVKNKWNAIRLGVVWAGAQPTEENKLDETFLKQLHDILDLTDKYNMHVILDNHGDMVGSAGCGNGAPMWIQKKVAGDLLGKPLKTDFPYNLFVDVKKVNGYDLCGNDKELWERFAGDPNYNILNPCCQILNSELGNINPAGLGFTTISQATNSFIFNEGKHYFVNFWRLMAEAVKNHPSASLMEFSNEPMYIYRHQMYEVWREISEAVNEVIPDMLVSLIDPFQALLLPYWVKTISPNIDIKKETIEWIKKSKTVYYAVHYLGDRGVLDEAIEAALSLQKEWNVPIIITEYDRSYRKAYLKHEFSLTAWRYGEYCNTGNRFRNIKDKVTFGACILG